MQIECWVLVQHLTLEWTGNSIEVELLGLNYLTHSSSLDVRVKK
jgi:hypothetical protein